MKLLLADGGCSLKKAYIVIRQNIPSQLGVSEWLDSYPFARRKLRDTQTIQHSTT
jgi:hypothetical protein